MQTGFLGLWGNKVDAIDYYTSEIEKLSKEVSGKFEALCILHFGFKISNESFSPCPNNSRCPISMLTSYLSTDIYYLS